MSKYRINLAGKTYEMEVERIDETVSTSEEPISSVWNQESKVNTSNPNVQIIDPAASKRTINEGNIVHSPMPGTIIKILVKNGDIVKKGQIILILEAMKMENEITAPRNGIIAGLNVIEKDTVQSGMILFEIKD